MLGCSICDSGNAKTINALLEEKGVKIVSKLYNIPDKVLTEHTKHTPELWGWINWNGLVAISKNYKHVIILLIILFSIVALLFRGFL